MKTIPILSLFLFSLIQLNAQETDTIVDPRDGQVYNIVRIGKQWWMAENLQATKYSDGTPLVEGTGGGDITGDYTTKYYFWYGDDSATYAATYGALYTWAAVMNGANSSITNPSSVQGICPDGWRLPSDGEWTELIDYLGGLSIAGGKLKEAGYTHWNSPNTGATNASGFTALPGGARLNYGSFSSMGLYADFGSSAEGSSSTVWVRTLSFVYSGVNRGEASKNDGLSVRCLRDFNYLAYLTISDDTLDFGIINHNIADTTQFIYLKNTYNNNLSIDSIYGGDPSFILDVQEAPDLKDIIIAPGDSVRLNITLFTENLAGSFIDTIGININSYDTLLILKAEIINFPATISVFRGNQQVTITWDSACWNYRDMIFIYRDTILVDSVGITSNEDTLYVDAGLNNYQDYSYFIRSKDIWGNLSIPSDTVSTSPCEIITDYDGNNYATVKIGDQIWMKENLKTTHYADGASLVDGTGVGIGDYTTKYWFVYEDNMANKATYGLLYTWAAIMNGAASSDANPSGVQGVCPTGWHMPGDNEWKELEMFLGMSQEEADATGTRGTDEGGKLKETGATHWSSPNIGATNSSGFTALPSGNRTSGGSFSSMGSYAFFWSSTEYYFSLAWRRLLYYYSSKVWYRNGYNEGSGYSVRCLRDYISDTLITVTYNKKDASTPGGHDGYIDLSVSGGTPPYQYEWNTGAFTQDISFLYPGIYTVTVTDTLNQTVNLTIEINQPAVQTCDILVEISCQIDSITQEVSFTPSTTDYELFWSFGDGNASSMSSPTYIYSHPGLYKVYLTAFDENSDCSYETCTMVKVGSPECIAGFSFYVDESDSMLLHFSDNSYGVASSWYWNFADGNISTDQDVDHRFNQAGTYQVCLFTLDNTTGCLSEACKEISIGAVELIADFSYFVNPVTLKATFTNNSSGNITDYYWTYGDGSVYSGKDSSHVYTDPGIYNVCLSIRNRTTGKFTEKCKKIKAGTLPCNVSAAFRYFVDPAARKVSFTSTSSGTIHSWFWNFGDGTSSSSANTVHQFSKPGYYLVSLSIRDTIARCNDFYATMIQVGAVSCKALFNYSVDPASLAVTLNDFSLGNIENYFWTFDDGFTSTERNPVHAYAKPGLYQISLTVTDATGTCMDYSASQVQVGYVDCSADFTVFIDSLSNTAWFSSQSLGSMIDYYWIFSDGKMSAEKNPVHTFSVPGYHKVSLNTYNELSGCMDHKEKIILVGSQGIDCEADFIYSADISNNTVTFTDQSLGKGLSWFWNFGDSDTSLTQNPVHQYNKGGYYNVCLTVYSSSGIQNISCKQVFAGVSATGNCLARFNFTVNDAELIAIYKDKSFGTPDTWQWAFGDGQASDVQNPSHIFAHAGYYTTRQKIVNQVSGCISNALALVSVNMEGGLIAGFGYIINSILRKAESYPVDYVGVSLGDASKYKWSFGDGTCDSTTTTPTHIYSAPGTYEVCLTVYDEVSGEENTTCDWVTVGSPSVNEHLKPFTTGQDIVLLCYPNPADDRYYVLFDLPSEAFTQIEVYTLSGKKIISVINKKLTKGRHVYELDATDLSSGLYIIKLYSDIRIATQIMSIQH